jgi:hypothetical protein
MNPTRTLSVTGAATSKINSCHPGRTAIRVLGILVAFSLIVLARGASAAEEPSRVTAQVVRETGVAMWLWLADQLPNKSVLDEKAGELTAPPWATCSTSRDELAALLVPKYISALPGKDGWGQDLQFCLQFEKAHPTRSALGVRSPGRDGKFTPGEYKVGRFEPSAAEEDTVWVNGYFIRWPQKADTSN